ncbi:MAG: DUF2069 domain-containing protein [Hydrogenophilus sp.]|nr:DUF2069 domain-containing protein [Hydrogenophilus sp.]
MINGAPDREKGEERRKEKSRLFWSIVASAIALTLGVVCVVWEGWGAPIRAGGSWLVVKALPLAFWFPGLVKGRLRSAQWTALGCSGYLLEAATRAFEPMPVRGWALAEGVLSVALFGAAVMVVRTYPRRK